MQAKKFLAVLLALTMTGTSMTALPIAAEETEIETELYEEAQTSEQESSENEQDKTDALQEAEQTEDEQETEADLTQPEDFFKITSITASWEDELVLIEVVSENTDYDKIYIGSCADEDKAPVIEAEMDDLGRMHYQFYIEAQYLGENAAYVPCHAESGEWMTDTQLYMQLPAEAAPSSDSYEDVSEEDLDEKDITLDEINETANAGLSEDTTWKIDEFEQVQENDMPDDFTFSGGTGKTILTCERLFVRDGVSWAQIKFSSSKFTRVVWGGNEYLPISNEGGSYFEIPVLVNEEMQIIGTTIGMGDPHDISYTIRITKEGWETPSATPAPEITVTPTPAPTQTPTPSPTPTVKPESEVPEDGNYAGEVEHVSGTASMFKILDCRLKIKKGKITAVITLSSTGYDRLFVGTKEDALKAKDKKLISYKVDKNGRYTYEIPVSALDQPIQISARSKRYYEAGEKDKMWYEHELSFHMEQTGSDGDSDQPVQTTPTPTPTTAPGSGNNSGTGSGGSGSGSNGSGGNSNTNGQTSQVDSSAGGLKDGEYGSDEFSFSWSGGTGTHGLSIVCDKISIESGQAWAYVTFGSNKWVYLKASGSQYDPISQSESHSTFKIPVQLNANNKVLGCTTAMSKPYEIEYTLYFGMDIPESGSTNKGSGSTGGSSTVKATAAKVSKGEEASTEAGTVWMDEDAPKITGLEYMSSLKLEHSKLFKIHYYNNDMTLLEIVVDEDAEEAADSGAQENMSADTQTEDNKMEDTKTAEDELEEQSSAAEQDYAKLYRGNTLQYLLVPQDKKEQVPAGLDKSVIVIDLPVEKAYVASEAALALMEKIQAAGNIKAVSVNAEDCELEKIREKMEKGEILTAGAYDQADFKLLVKEKCDLAVIPSEILDQKTDTQNESQDPVHSEMTDLAEKFALLKIPMILDRSKDEEDTLAKYEWSKVCGALFGSEKEASDLYENAVNAHEKETDR